MCIVTVKAGTDVGRDDEDDEDDDSGQDYDLSL